MLWLDKEKHIRNLIVLAYIWLISGIVRETWNTGTMIYWNHLYTVQAERTNLPAILDYPDSNGNSPSQKGSN